MKIISKTVQNEINAIKNRKEIQAMIDSEIKINHPRVFLNCLCIGMLVCSPIVYLIAG